MTVAIVCGGRNFEDVDFIIDKLNKLRTDHSISKIIAGGATGVDTIAALWAKEVGLPVDEYIPDWNRFGLKAGFLRNKDMLKDGKPDLVIGFPGGSGTRNMLDIAIESRVQVIDHPGLYFTKEDVTWGFLSNFHRSEFIDDDGVIYPTNEHYYQSQKTLNEKERSWVVAAESPNEARKRGQQVNTQSGWDLPGSSGRPLKVEVMLDGLRRKFSAGGSLTNRLKISNRFYLIEYTTWHDTYWGVDTKLKGQNWLGRLLMEVRTEIQ